MQLRHAFTGKLIACKLKYLMDFKFEYLLLPSQKYQLLNLVRSPLINEIR